MDPVNNFSCSWSTSQATSFPSAYAGLVLPTLHDISRPILTGAASLLEHEGRSHSVLASQILLCVFFLVRYRHHGSGLLS